MYQFPLIRHINEVLPYVVSNPHFVVIEREYGRIIDYVISDDTTFEDPEDHFLSSDDIQGRLIRRECRGLIFDNDGNIISRALHKFHNIGEKKYSQLENLNFSKPFRVGEKLDGSMIRPFMANGYIRWGTRKGITDVSMQAEEFVAEHVNYQEFASYFLSIGYTPIFEWCSRKQRIVIDHASDRLVLLAIRNQETGVYYPYLEMAVHAAEFRVEYLKWDLVTDPKDLISKIKDDTDREGIVIQFTDSGLFVKMKTDWYVLLHRTKDQLGREKDGIKLILMDGIDDLLPILLHDDKEALIAFQIAFNKEIARKANRICIGVHTNMVKYPTKRDAIAFILLSSI
jgi:RNA ligase